MSGPCSATGCERPVQVYIRGLCRMHNQRLRRTGTTDPGQRLADRPIVVDGDIARVHLTRGMVAFIDAVDVDLVAPYRWFAATVRSGVAYAQASLYGSGGGVAHMHRVITDAPDGMFVDHVDGDGLNNRRGNLRVCTTEQNIRNVHVLRSHNTSGHLGVGWREDRQRWRAYVKTAGRMHHIGYFTAADEAARARDDFIREHFPSEFWTFNFPRPNERGVNRARRTA